MPFESAATTVAFSGLSSTVETWWPLVVEVLREPAFRPDALNALKAQLRSSVTMSRAHAGFVAREALGRRVFGGHPAAVALPTLEAVDALTPARVRAWHETRYVPEQTLVTIAGDVDAGRLTALVRRLLGDWPRGGRELPPLPLPSRPTARTLTIIDRPGSAQAALALGNLGIARADADYAAVAVANQVLGEGPASRLFRRLRSRDDAYNVWSNFTALGYPGGWRVYADVRTGSAARAVGTVLEELDRLSREPVPPEERLESQQAVLARFALSLEELDRVASHAAVWTLYGCSPDYWDSYPAKVIGVSAADIARVARKYLDPDAVEVVAVGDRAHLTRALTPFGPIVPH